MTFQYLSRSLLRSFSQIMLQENKLTGFLFCLGLGISSPIMLFGAVIAVLSSLVIAELFLYSENNVQKGLYGFNGSLLAIALHANFEKNQRSIFNTRALNTILFIGMMCFGLILTVLLTSAFEQARLPALTAPFILSTWFILALHQSLNRAYQNKQQKVKLSRCN